MALVVFTIFGQGRQHHWSYLTTDKEKYKYFLDDRSVRQVAPAVYAFLLQRRRDDMWVQSRFTLDLQRCTLQKEREEPVLIRPGTVAEELRQALARRLQASPPP